MAATGSVLASVQAETVTATMPSNPRPAKRRAKSLKVLNESIVRAPEMFRMDGGSEPRLLQCPDHEIDQFFRPRAIFLGEALRHHLRVAKCGRRGTEASGGTIEVLLAKLSGIDSFMDKAGIDLVKAVDMLFDHMPVALDGDDDHLVHFLL